ncbi:MAG: prepilin-type N-terminal cleavage/methylation domain-containing protein [bacterium]
MKQLKNGEGFTLLELLIVLVIVGIMLFITYPVIKGDLFSFGGNPRFSRIISILKNKLDDRFERSGKTLVMFNISKNYMELFYKKGYKIKPEKYRKDYLVRFKTIELKKIVSCGKSVSKGSFYFEVSKNYAGPPFSLYFNAGGSVKILKINTYYNKISVE